MFRDWLYKGDVRILWKADIDAATNPQRSDPLASMTTSNHRDCQSITDHLYRVMSTF